MILFSISIFCSAEKKVGPPRNVTVKQTDEGDEFVVSWYAPEYGLEYLSVYVVNEFCSHLTVTRQRNFGNQISFLRRRAQN